MPQQFDWKGNREPNKTSAQLFGSYRPLPIPKLLNYSDQFSRILELVTNHDYSGARVVAGQIGDPDVKFKLLLLLVIEGSKGGWGKAEAREALQHAQYLNSSFSHNGVSRAAGMLEACDAGQAAGLLEPDEILPTIAVAIAFARDDQRVLPITRFYFLMDIAGALSTQGRDPLLPGLAFSSAGKCALQAASCHTPALPDYLESARMLQAIAMAQRELSFPIADVLATYDMAIAQARQIPNIQESAILVHELAADSQRALDCAPPTMPTIEN